MPKSNGKDAYYFSHDCNARNDNKILAMRSVYGAEGYGLYWMIVEILRDQPDYKYPLGKYAFRTLAIELHFDEKRLEDFILDCCSEFADGHSSLLKMDENHLWSESLNRRMKLADEVSSKRRKAAETRWGARDDASALHKQSKEEQTRADQSRPDQSRAEQNSTCTAAAAMKGFELSHIVDAYQAQTGKRPGEVQCSKLSEYIDAMTADVVQWAFQLAEDAGAEKWSYTKRILDDWMDAGVRSLQDAKAERSKRFGRSGSPGGASISEEQRKKRIMEDMDAMDRMERYLKRQEEPDGNGD